MHITAVIADLTRDDMFSGILESEVEHGGNLEDLFSHLNSLLCHKLDKRTFVCFAMDQIELSSGRGSGPSRKVLPQLRAACAQIKGRPPSAYGIRSMGVLLFSTPRQTSQPTS